VAQDDTDSIRTALEQLALARLDLKERLGEKHPNLVAIEAQIASLKASLEKVSKNKRASEINAQLARKTQDLKAVLYTTQLKLEEAKQKFGPGHPSVKRLERQISFYETMIADMQTKAKQEDVHKEAIAQRQAVLQALKFLEKASTDFQSISGEEKQMQAKIQELLALQKQLEAKTAMLGQMQERYNQRVAQEKDVTNRNKMKLREKEAQAKATAELMKAHELQAKAMDEQLRKAEERAKAMQEEMLVRAKLLQRERGNTKDSGQGLTEKIDRLQSRMNNMEAMLKKIMTKLDSISDR